MKTRGWYNSSEKVACSVVCTRFMEGSIVQWPWRTFQLAIWYRSAKLCLLIMMFLNSNCLIRLEQFTLQWSVSAFPRFSSILLKSTASSPYTLLQPPLHHRLNFSKPRFCPFDMLFTIYTTWNHNISPNWPAMSLFTPRVLRLPAILRLSLIVVKQGQQARFSSCRRLREDPRIQELGKVIKDEFAVLREDYST